MRSSSDVSGRLFVLAPSRAHFIDCCRSEGLSHREYLGETFFCDEGYRVRSQVILPDDEVLYVDGWRNRSGARHLLNDIQLMLRRRSLQY